MINITNIAKSFGAQVLLEDCNFNVNSKERIGLVGRNGSGKSTLLKIILGQELADKGEVKIPKGYKLATLDQHIHFEQNSVLDECIQALPPENRYDHYLAQKYLFGLGFSKEDLARSPHSFSGGYQVRINLVKALLQSPNMLLLDEPTNYLDIVSLRWLRNFLQSYPGEVLLITHDREFMDSVCTHIIGINRHCLRKIKGDTEKYYTQIEQEEIIYEQTRANQEKKVKEVQDFVDRFRSKASKAKQAQSRLKMLSKMTLMEKLESEGEFGFSFHYAPISAKNVAEVNELSFGYEEGRPLFSNLKFTIGKSDRIAIVGKNGKGKSTLLNVLGGFLNATAGTFSFHNDVKIGHFGQTNIDRLHKGNSIAQEVQSANPSLSQTAVRNICGCMMFEGDKADKRISVLSGGERSRVMLGKILAKPANLLMLDEPTNHLDMESIEVLSDEIETFPGAVIFVTHSEKLLRQLANRLIIFREGGAEYFHGTYEDFLNKIGWEEEGPAPTKSAVVETRISNKEKRRLKSELVSKQNRECGQKKSELDNIENEIIELESLQEKFNVMIQQKVDEGQDALEFMIQIDKINNKIEEKFSELEKLQLELENLTEFFEVELRKLD